VAQAGGDCIAVVTDVTQEDSVRAAIETAVRHYGGLHILHNNAGGSTPVDSTVVEVPIEEFWRAIRLDLFGTRFSAAASAYRQSSPRAADR
jgi:NAD(P)-dependent dehydrogenase (short-subunit alcohol dehydrogenase family)